MKRRLSAWVLIVNLLLSLIADPVIADGTSADPSRPSFASRHRKALLWTCGLTAIAAGGVAVAHRQQANDRFADYESTADPDLIQQRYDQTVSLDRRAAAFFLTAELAFVALVYVGFFVRAAPVERLAASRTADGTGRTVVPPAEPAAGWQLRRTPAGAALAWAF